MHRLWLVTLSMLLGTEHFRQATAILARQALWRKLRLPDVVGRPSAEIAEIAELHTLLCVSVLTASEGPLQPWRSSVADRQCM